MLLARVYLEGRLSDQFKLYSVMLAALQLAAGMNVVFEWSSLHSRYPDVDTGAQVPERGVPFSLEVWRNMVFLTVPRWRSGVAASISYIRLPTGAAVADKSPFLRPYPSWAWHYMHALVRNTDALQNLIISPYRVRADICNQLWVLDSGLADLLGTLERIAPTRLLIFNLETEQLVHIAALPQNVTSDKSSHTNFVVDIRAKNCGNAFAYIADVGEAGLIVYSFANDTFWRMSDDSVTNGSYFADMALSFPVEGDAVLYLHHGEMSISTELLKRMDTEKLQLDDIAEDSIMSGSSDMDKWTDTFFYTQESEKQVLCCNMMLNCAPDTEGHLNTSLFPSDVRLDQEGNIWLLETYTTRSRHGLLTPDAVNYQILSGSVEEVTESLPCFTSHRKHFPSRAAVHKVHVLATLLLVLTSAWQYQRS